MFNKNKINSFWVLGIILGLSIASVGTILVLAEFSNLNKTNQFSSVLKQNEQPILVQTQTAVKNDEIPSPSSDLNKSLPEEEKPAEKPAISDVEKPSQKPAESIKISEPVKETEIKPKQDEEILETPVEEENYGKPVSLDDYRALLYNRVYSKVFTQDAPPNITGDEQVDEKIRNLAISKGYRIWQIADESSLVSIGKARTQPELKKDWEEMQKAAAKSGVVLGITSGYRSPADQAELFKQRLYATINKDLGRDLSSEEIISGIADSSIEKTLNLTAPPGFSRHHTGYTLDILDLSPDNKTTVFYGSKAYNWLNKTNYLNARKYGFVPSYPKGLTGIGPNPEPWEYVWVGKSELGF